MKRKQRIADREHEWAEYARRVEEEKERDRQTVLHIGMKLSGVVSSRDPFVVHMADMADGSSSTVVCSDGWLHRTPNPEEVTCPKCQWMMRAR